MKTRFKDLISLKMKRGMGLLVMLLLIAIQGMAQSVLKVEFQSEIQLDVFLVKQIKGELSKSFAEKEPYVQSATLNVSIDLNGNILKMDFVEESQDKEFNKLVVNLVNSTNGKWKPMNVPEGVEVVHLIIPFLQKTPPYDMKKNRPELIQSFKDYHASLILDDIVGCSSENCIIFPEIGNFIGPGTRGIR